MEAEVHMYEEKIEQVCKLGRELVDDEGAQNDEWVDVF